MSKFNVGDMVQVVGQPLRTRGVTGRVGEVLEYDPVRGAYKVGGSVGDKWVEDFALDPFKDHTRSKTSTGGPSSYYDMPFSDWTTVNDMMEYLAEHKWGKYGIHLKDIFKGVCRWGEKSGTTQEYDAKKIIYYGARVLMMIVGKDKLREYLKELLDDKQFK